MIKTRAAVCLFLAVFLSGCGGVDKGSSIGPSGKSMKGYELYSWQEGIEWRYSLLVGTNRIKTQLEVTSSESKLAGWEALESQLGRLAEGEQVFWIVDRVPGMTLPPEEVVEKVRLLCEQRGIHLEIVD